MTGIQIRIADLLFNRMNSADLLEKVLGEPAHQWYSAFIEQFEAIAESCLSGYSSPEQQCAFEYFIKGRAPECSKSVSGVPPFCVLTDIADRILEYNSRQPQCRCTETLNWREVYLSLGQDIFVTSWLAKNETGIERFTWPAVIRVNNSIISGSLNNNMSENHMHLYAGAQTFSLNWACMMNRPLDIDWEEKKMSFFLQSQSVRSSESHIWSVKRKSLYAAEIRLLLFKYLTENSETLSSGSSDVLKDLRKFHFSYDNDDAVAGRIAREAAIQRMISGVFFPQPEFGLSYCMDYAFQKTLMHESGDSLRLLAPERWFLYECFRRCFGTDGVHFPSALQWAFYLYLILKAQIRSEFIQVNGQVGFVNFQNYDRRKKITWRGIDSYKHENIYQGINATLNEQKLRSLEVRIGPWDSPAGNYDSIQKTDRDKLYFDAGSADERLPLQWFGCSSVIEQRAVNEKFFYVLSFPKEEDRNLGTDKPGLHCRHEEYRIKLKKTAVAIAKALSNSDYLCQRIRGIDTCSNELVCRPEVFGMSYRFLSQFSPEKYRFVSAAALTPFISRTYHVGEDFPDIADGLRAVDEAVYFLNLKRGDRLGHALVLGVDPQIHYTTKHMQIFLSKQSYLDNLVWLLFRSIELGVSIDVSLREKFRQQAFALFRELYSNSSDENSHITLDDYYHSMLLRGDSPQCYADFGKCHYLPAFDQFDNYCLNENPDIREKLDRYRRSPEVCQLLYAYHFDNDVKSNGKKTDTREIDPGYIRLMGEMQAAMRCNINNLGIRIECNPSSNVLIGSFKSYRNHPIFRFYSRGLADRNQTGTQMHVSVNSDDPGVFDTSLSFEYMLIAGTLSEMRDENDNAMYGEREIEDYIRALVRMGNEQVFPPCT